MMAILTGLRWNLEVVLIGISLVAKDIAYFLKYLLAACIPSLETFMYLATVTCMSMCTATEFPIAGNGVNLDTH